jgi:hypothetical protein
LGHGFLAEVLAVVRMRASGGKARTCVRAIAAGLRRLALLAALAALLAGCNFEPLLPPADCSDDTDIFRVDLVLGDAAHPCRDWVAQAAGRVGRTPNASATAWTLRTGGGTAVVVSALHALDVGDFGPAATTVPAALLDPAVESVVIPVRWPVLDAGMLADARLAFPLAHPPIPAKYHRDDFDGLLPRNDFYVAAVGGADDLAIEPADPLVFDDPNAWLHATPSFGSAAAGDLVLLVGFPRLGLGEAAQSASIGRVLSDEEAHAAVLELAAVGDVEGDIPYDAEAEFLFDGHAAGGMSGGGVFDEAGRLVGILVRASDPRDGKQVGRAVRMTFIAAQLAAIVVDADEPTRAAAEPYLELGFP